MITKGVASVRSPVCNLQQFNCEITHDSFTNAIVREFKNEYGIDTPVRMLKFDSVLF
jgi:lipoate---protein ligase